MSFYVTLPSHANRSEFPNNQANSFKIRLPSPLRLLDQGWQVGLSSISMPDTTTDLTALAPLTTQIMGMGCYKAYPGNFFKYHTHNLPLKTIQDDGWVQDGVSFMKVCLKWFDKRFQEVGFRYYGYEEKDRGKNTCGLFTWDKDELLLDNSNVSRKKFGSITYFFPYFAINAIVALKMGWFKQNDKGGIDLGPNLIMIFPNGRVPAPCQK